MFAIRQVLLDQLTLMVNTSAINIKDGKIREKLELKMFPSTVYTASVFTHPPNARDLRKFNFNLKKIEEVRNNFLCDFLCLKFLVVARIKVRRRRI